MRSRLFLPVLCLVLCIAPSAEARLGETLDDIRKQFGKPGTQPRKDSAFWLIEGNDGLLNYTVTFNSEGKSIAEGLKPVRRARFTEADARGFIEAQLRPWDGSETLRTLKPGEKYQFGGKEFVCGNNESIAVDEPNDLLVIWTKGSNVMVISSQMVRGLK